jgi:hypothetical protein
MSGTGGPVTHGAMQFWKRGILKPGQKKTAAFVDAICHEIIQDMGGNEAITGTQKVLLAQLRRCLIFQILIDRWLAEHEFIDEGGNLPPSMNNFYLAAMNSSCRIAEKLSFKRAGSIDTLESYLSKTYPGTKPAAGAAQAAGTDKPLSKRAGKKRSSPTIDPGEVNHE